MSSTRFGRVKCPRCGQVWDIPWGDPGTECTCHLWCSSGAKQSDCTVTYPYNFSGGLGYPEGLHVKAANEGDNIWQRGGYCSTHSKYTNKEPVFLEVDWKRYEKTRLPANLRTTSQ